MDEDWLFRAQSVFTQTVFPAIVFNYSMDVHAKPEVMSLRNCESEVLDVNLNEIDDKEFDIPPLEQQPTLDSILSLPDDEQSLVDSEVSFAAEFPLPGHAPFVHPVGVCAFLTVDSLPS